MKSLALLPLSLLVLLAGCQSSTANEPVATANLALTEPEHVECVCGDPQGELLGCPHPDCVSRAGNSENPDCLCAGLAVLPGSGAGTAVSAGGEPATNRLLGIQQILTLKDGKTVRGELVFDDGGTIRLKFTSGNTKNYSYDELAPKSVYRLMKARTSNDDGPGQLAVGNYARDAGYYAHARRHYEYALQADPSLADQVDQELGELRSIAARNELEAAQNEFRAGRTAEAEKHLANVLREFPDEAAAGEATAMLGELQAREAAETRSARDTSGEVAKALEKATDRYDRAVKGNRDGLLASRSQSKSIKLYESSLKEGERSRKEIEKALERYPDLPGLSGAAASLDGQVVSAMIDANLNLASAYTVRESYGDALAAANAALALDPKNAEARSARARIEVAASNDGWGGPWVVRRR